MHPAFSVIFLTTLIGAAQGLFLALFSTQLYSELNILPDVSESNFYGIGAIVALAFLVTGLFASFFHLGRPERAWRSAARWRTSWLSREVIVLPLMMATVFVYGAIHLTGFDGIVYSNNANINLSASLFVGMFGVAVTFALFICTAMIYACIKFLQEWSSPLTVFNYILLGMASGFILSTVLTSYFSLTDHTLFLGNWAIVLTIAAFFSRSASLYRNNRIKHKSSVQTAIGVRHSTIKQVAQGAMGGSFNTREFFHGKTAAFLKSIKYIFMVLVFPVPLILMIVALDSDNAAFFAAAFIVQYIGLLAERWFFFAQANHPQNIYYQTV